MNDTTISAASFEKPELPPLPQPAGLADRGLRSTPAIRWLLLAGALVSGVSVFKMVQEQWGKMTAPPQFLILVGGALAIFGLGILTRQRLRLPYAGSALLFLFTGLVPVLAFGAHYLKLLDTPWGWIAFGAGTAVLLGAAVSVLRSVLRYRGWIYPAAFGTMLFALPVLPQLSGPKPSETFYGTAALLLGAVLYAGSRHANRFFFHRDRLDGEDRPVHLVPFLLLGVLYAGGMILLGLKSAFLALPVAVLGAVLISTGEEYYRALARSLGRAPERWPRRSVALLALGFSLAVAAVPLSLLDSTVRCLALTALLATGLFLRWSLRYSTASVHALGIATAAVVWYAFPALLGFKLGDPLNLGWSHLGFLAALTVFGAVMARLQIPEKLRRTHGVLISLYLLGITILGVIEPATPLFLTTALALTVAGLPFLRRVEPMAVAVLTLAALAWTGSGKLDPACLSGSVVLALILASRFLEGGLSRLTGASIETARRALLGPAVAVGSFLILHAAYVTVMTGRSSLLAIEAALAGAIWMVAGIRLRSSIGFTVGGMTLSLGLHLFLFLELHGFSPWMAVLTQALFLLYWAAVSVHPRARILAFLHGALGVIWLAHAALDGLSLTLESPILLLIGLALLRDGLANRQRRELEQGLLLAVAWAPLQILGTGWLQPWTTALPVGLTLAGAIFMMLIALARRAPGHSLARRYGIPDEEWDDFIDISLSDLTGFWRILAAATCLLLAGPTALVLALTLIGVEIVARREIRGVGLRQAFPTRLSLIPLLQLALLIAGGGREAWTLTAAFSHPMDLFQIAVALALAWSLGVRALGKQDALSRWVLALQGGTALGIGIAFLVSRLTTRPLFEDWGSAVLIAVAAVWTALSIQNGLRRREPKAGWLAQIWVGFAVLHGFTAGWLHLGSGFAPYVLLALGTAEYAAGALLARTDRGPAFAPSCRRIGLALPIVAGFLALGKDVNGSEASIWFHALPVFLTSLFYTVAASREPRRIFPALASAGFLGMALLSVILGTSPGPAFYSLAPGLALLALAWLLRSELGPTWSRHLTAAGATCVYATPIIAISLSSQISWTWLAVLLVLTVAFGAASFVLRSRSLLTVSTAAMLTDLGFFVFHLDEEAPPTALWGVALAFGLTLMGVAAWLEYQREGVLQQIRVFGRELRTWN